MNKVKELLWFVIESIVRCAVWCLERVVRAAQSLRRRVQPFAWQHESFEPEARLQRITTWRWGKARLEDYQWREGTTAEHIERRMAHLRTLPPRLAYTAIRVEADLLRAFSLRGERISFRPPRPHSWLKQLILENLSPLYWEQASLKDGRQVIGVMRWGRLHWEIYQWSPSTTQHEIDMVLRGLSNREAHAVLGHRAHFKGIHFDWNDVRDKALA